MGGQDERNTARYYNLKDDSETVSPLSYSAGVRTESVMIAASETECEGHEGGESFLSSLM